MSLETHLTQLHVRLGAKLVEFEGHTLPISYPHGIIAEHQPPRSKAGLYAGSQLGQVQQSASHGA